MDSRKSETLSETLFARTFANVVASLFPISILSLLFPDKVITHGTMIIFATLSVAVVSFFLEEKILRAERLILTFINSEMIDHKLSELAVEFHEAATAETRLKHEFANKIDETDEDRQRLTRAEEILRTKKEEFWSTANLAQSFSFKVHKRYKDYLPQKTA